MTYYEEVSLPSEAMMVRLIEEQLWCGYDGVDAMVKLPLGDTTATYLREAVFPTLVPALHELLKRVQQANLRDGAFSDRYGATGNTHPLSWLAQYLLRNNIHESRSLEEHPYVLVNNEVLRKQKEASEGMAIDDDEQSGAWLYTISTGGGGCGGRFEATRLFLTMPWVKHACVSSLSPNVCVRVRGSGLREIHHMELDLEAASRALEGLVAPSTSNGGSLSSLCQRSKKNVGLRDKKVSAVSSADYGDGRKSNSREAAASSRNGIHSTLGTQEVLVASSKTKVEQQQQQQLRQRERRPAPRLVSSPNQIPCKVIEASGLGASAILLGGTATVRHVEDRVWRTNLLQTPNPYIVLNCNPKHFSRREVISHVAPTMNSPGSHVERVRDIVVSIAFDTPLEALEEEEEEEEEAVIQRLVVSCSNHPRTGYVNVLRVSDIVGTLTRAVVPGTLIGPFLKLTLFPSDSLRTRVLRVSAAELAHADSWTERRIIEEPLGPLSEENDALFSDPVSSPHKTSGAKAEEEHHTESRACPPSLMTETKTGNSSLANFSALISSVGSVREDAESLMGSRVLRGKKSECPGRTSDATLVRDDTGGSETPRTNLGKRQTHSRSATNEKKVFLARSRARGGTKESRPSKKNPATRILESLQTTEGVGIGEPKPSNALDDGEGVHETSPRGNDTDRQRLSKALIAWGIKRRLLQDENIMRSLHEDCEESFYTSESDQQGLEGRRRGRACSDPLCCQEPHGELSRSLEVLQARRIWEAVSLWSRRDALLEAMMNSSTLCLATARTSEEVFASLPQPHTMQILLVLSGDVQRRGTLTSDCFDLMMTIAHGERQRGYEAELVFRMDDGFGCILHPHRDMERGRQWLLVSLHQHSADVNEWILEALRMHKEIALLGGKSSHERAPSDSSAPSAVNDELIYSSRLPVLRSVLDFACLLETLLPALLPWLSVGDMCYYGDVQPVLFPFIDDCGVIHPTCWFHCILHGAVRSVLLSLPGSDGQATAGECSQGTPPTTQRRLACMTLRRHVPFCAVWQPQNDAVKVVLTNVHALHHIDLLDGVLMCQGSLALARALLPHTQRRKLEVLKEEEEGPSVVGTSSLGPSAAAAVAAFPGGSGTTSGVAFQSLSVSLRHSWRVVGIALPIGGSFDEDAFMDTVLRWAYALPRVVVLFYSEHMNGETLPPLSAGFLEAFAAVLDVETALAA